MSDLYRDYLDYDQVTSKQDDPNDDHDTLVVNHVKGLLNEVMEAVVNYNNSDDNIEPQAEKNDDEDIVIPTVIMVYEDADGNSSSPISSTKTTTHTSSSFKNNTHLILVENGNVTVLLLNKPHSEDNVSDRKSQNKKVENIQTISSSSFYDGNFKNISFSQVGSNPSGLEKNGSNQQMSSFSSNVVHFKNSSNNVVTDHGDVQVVQFNITDTIIDDGDEDEAMQIGDTLSSAIMSTSTTTTSTTTTTTSTSTTTSSTSTSTTSTTTSSSTTTTTTVSSTSASTTRSTTKKTTVRTTPAPPPTTTTPPPSLLQALAQQVGVAMATVSGIASFNPLYLLLGRRRRSFGENISNTEVARQFHISHIVQSENVKL